MANWFGLFGKADTEKPMMEVLAETITVEEVISDTEKPMIHAMARSGSSTGQFRYLFTHSFDGSKNLGELGPVKSYILNYDILRLRSWQAYLESDIARTIINRFVTWVIGNGLKLQSQPVKSILAKNGVTIDQSFSRDVEAMWSVYAGSTMCDFSNMKNLGAIAEEAYINAINGGDVLNVLRYIDGEVKIQLIDAAHIVSRNFGSETSPLKLANGNFEKCGIEMKPSGEHVGYWIRNYDYSYEFIEAINKVTGLKQAWLTYGVKYRLDNVRGMPILSVGLESMKKLERYKEATLGSAEERQKIVYSIEHGPASTGEYPMMQGAAKAFNFDGDADLPRTDDGKELASNIQATTNKQTWNMPIGSKLASLESKNELYFKDFYDTNFNILCASFGIPPDVARSLYNSNFSASRAALKDWGNTLDVSRGKFANEFYKNIFEFWLHMQILKNTIKAPGYLVAHEQGNIYLLVAYRTSRWVGQPVPHIDPLKEVNAQRMMLGDSGASVPLTTVEAATEALSQGESQDNIEQYAEELKKTKALGIKSEVPQAVPV